jgi:hypothetical protein
MRGDTMSSQLGSAPSEEFLNRYSTSSIAEDKAEIWVRAVVVILLRACPDLGGCPPLAAGSVSVDCLHLHPP